MFLSGVRNQCGTQHSLSRWIHSAAIAFQKIHGLTLTVQLVKLHRWQDGLPVNFCTMPSLAMPLFPLHVVHHSMHCRSTVQRTSWYVAMAGWLHGVFVVDWLFVFPLCGFSLSLFCNYFGVSDLTD